MAAADLAEVLLAAEEAAEAKQLATQAVEAKLAIRVGPFAMAIIKMEEQPIGLRKLAELDFMIKARPAQD